MDLGLLGDELEGIARGALVENGSNYPWRKELEKFRGQVGYGQGEDGFKV